MKITSKILHLPPYLSTTWLQVRALYYKDNKLIVSLINNESIEIPQLPGEILEQIFTTYAAFLEEREPGKLNMPHKFDLGPNAAFQIFKIGVPPQEGSLQSPFAPPSDKNMPLIKMNLDSIESITESMQHNSALADSPPIPNEVLQKIAEIARIVGSDDIRSIPKPEPHCNCPHCQISRTIHNFDAPSYSSTQVEQPKEEVIMDQDLQFQQWNIHQSGDKLYAVTNRLDPLETFNVYLGDPVGCTCGIKGCEHILAVLKS